MNIILVVLFLVAARSKEEAKEFTPHDWNNYTEPEEVEKLTADVEFPKVIFDYTYFE